MEVEKRRFTDFFDLLEVDRNASKEDVQKAFMLKASVWHPDKAESEGDREYYTKIYQDLQTAYKILSSEHSRKQYMGSQQTTNLEFKFAERVVGYTQTDQFRADDGKFDENAFQAAFEQTRNQKEIDAIQQLQQSRYGQKGTINDRDLRSLLARREDELTKLNAETAQVFSGSGKDFDSGTFNRAFDYMKEKNPGKGVQLYEGDPIGRFSGGLEECSATTFYNGTDFTGQHMDNLVLGQSINPGTELDLKALRTGDKYGQEQKLTNGEIQSRLAVIHADREHLTNMNKDQFIVEPSEIERLYSDLFQPSNIEGLEAPISVSMIDQKGGDTVLRDSDRNKIRRKIEQKKPRIETLTAQKMNTGI
jgi:curved DNA-binding protein CbpA